MFPHHVCCKYFSIVARNVFAIAFYCLVWRKATRCGGNEFLEWKICLKSKEKLSQKEPETVLLQSSLIFGNACFSNFSHSFTIAKIFFHEPHRRSLQALGMAFPDANNISRCNQLMWKSCRTSLSAFALFLVIGWNWRTCFADKTRCRVIPLRFTHTWL